MQGNKEKLVEVTKRLKEYETDSQAIHYLCTLNPSYRECLTIASHNGVQVDDCKYRYDILEKVAIEVRNRDNCICQ